MTFRDRPRCWETLSLDFRRPSQSPPRASAQAPFTVRDVSVPSLDVRSSEARSEPSRARPVIRGKLFFIGDEKFYVRGVTYGAFRPDEHKNEYFELPQIDRDFAQMAANGINAFAFRIPPRHARSATSPMRTG